MQCFCGLLCWELLLIGIMGHFFDHLQQSCHICFGFIQRVGGVSLHLVLHGLVALAKDNGEHLHLAVFVLSLLL